MAPPKKSRGTDKKSDREKYRKPYRMFRVRIALAEIAEGRAKSLEQKATQYVNDAIRMRLETEGAWPPGTARPPLSLPGSVHKAGEYAARDDERRKPTK